MVGLYFKLIYLFIECVIAMEYSDIEDESDFRGLYDPLPEVHEMVDEVCEQAYGVEDVAEEVSACPGYPGESDGQGSVGSTIPRVSLVRSRRSQRLRAQAFFLTYSQSCLRKEEVTGWFFRQPRVRRCICAMEHHQDGNVHYHVLVEYEQGKDVTPKYFDIMREHPNVLIWPRGTQSYDDWLINHWNYCMKEDEDCFTIGSPPINKKRKRDDIATEACKRARETGVAEAMKYLEENAAWEHLTKYDAIYRAMMSIRNKGRVVTPARPLSTFKDLPLIVDDWRNLYINGPTGCGKTAWARALLPEATVISHRDQLRDCDFSKGIIFDDFEVSHWPPTAVIHLLDWEEPRGLDVKHGHVIIPPHTRKIFTHNCPFEDWIPQGGDKMNVSNEQKLAMRRRVNVVNIYSPLF